MKLVKIKPKLVDPTWYSTEKPIIKKTPVISLSKKDTNFSFYYNLIAILILCIGSYLLYNRYCEKDHINEKKRYEISQFHRYVNDKLSS